MQDSTEYKFYIVAFLDVMGQKAEFRDLRSFPTTEEAQGKVIQALKNTVGFIEKFREGLTGFFDSYSKPTQIASRIPAEHMDTFRRMCHPRITLQGFADSAIIFCPFVVGGSPADACGILSAAYGILVAIGVMTLVSLFGKHAVRGGIEVAPAVEAFPGEVYGPALNEAYRLESSVAVYPRILLGKGFMDYLHSMAKVPQTDIYGQFSAHMAATCLGMLAQDVDGYPFLDYLGGEFLRLAGEVEGMVVQGRDIKMADLLKGAYNHVTAQQKKWQQEGNSKLAFRYLALSRYFEARLSEAPAEEST